MKPEEAKFLAGVIGQNLQGEWMHTYKVISAIPEGKKDYKPEAHSRTAWEIATHMLAFEGDSKVVWFEGNYQDYEADRKRRLGAEADQPHRIKYRKLTRS